MAYMMGAKEVLPTIALCMAGSGVVFHAIRNQKVLGGEVPTTLNEEWADKTVRLSAAKPREGCDRPIAMEPMTNGFPMNFSVTEDGTWSLKVPKRSKSASYLHGYDKPTYTFPEKTDEDDE
ncbi:hypothetical protein HKI87_19g88390 [Chloropicon roscoffensis]|uniref:Uncharacterized protein n=1 Tax=Chloropicon roscoffensis TaxID=1461544 RepID=A0A7S3CD67_9CHLO|mmetsp:Transcript_6003/g.18164  ORF Transcript_6003/g.18164 Transcript_6003/m.18164 type:complete len:121 (+) Transcript_6003:71-433(+)|eukprot:CAMPEP_0198467986 /NCGR_PEP_ID=MMETSP1456-20131121/6203_1 /TAXON_ID=1461544 ORGANISM="Unidentified sp., Strain RCC1871" /NCGR_SAMPLE_ID=MMETSP1456 /ASSEMBLY_ACC=CAM_ASM_001119 /LENGTH=120 /DNA_ID=CAMNT_0044194107 /DNA_START=53 /DNA_END=415 /DNA_ORIENTATION=-